nr:hypothetical protein CFP56_55934 [Quercus suber]
MAVRYSCPRHHELRMRCSDVHQACADKERDQPCNLTRGVLHADDTAESHCTVNVASYLMRMSHPRHSPVTPFYDYTIHIDTGAPGVQYVAGRLALTLQILCWRSWLADPHRTSEGVHEGRDSMENKPLIERLQHTTRPTYRTSTDRCIFTTRRRSRSRRRTLLSVVPSADCPTDKSESCQLCPSRPTPSKAAKDPKKEEVHRYQYETALIMADSSETSASAINRVHDDDQPDVERADPITHSSSDPSEVTALPSVQGPSVTASAHPPSVPRNRSPYSGSHVRSSSGGTTLLNAPLMVRARSMPNPHTLDLPSTSATFSRSPSTSSSTSRSLSPNTAAARIPATNHTVRGHASLGPGDGNVTSLTPLPPAPLRNPSSRSSEGPPSALTRSAVQTIEEHSELDIRPLNAIPTVPLPAASAAFARSSSLRRRPASPLHSGAVAQTLSSTPMSESIPSTSSSPSLAPTRFVNEAYPQLHHSASTSSFSSVPSTPSSIRSRSPSISSLDTIEDTPDLESEAIELERIERLKLSAERAERAESGEDTEEGGRRRSSLDASRTGFGRTGRAGSERKRWSICGGERRGDLDLETIWED